MTRGRGLRLPDSRLNTAQIQCYDEKGDLKDGAITVYRVEGGGWKVMETAGAK